MGLPALLLALGLAGVPPGDERPNILLAIADDLDPAHLGFSGNPLARTPRLDRLASEGLVFPTLYAQNVCRPALATLLTGRWPHETGMLCNMVPQPLAPSGALPELLRAKGYATYCGGKFWEGNLPGFGFDAPAQNDDRFARSGEDGQADLYRFLEARAEQGPWFVWWAPSLPHTPHRPPVRFAKDFAEVEIPVPAEFRGRPAEFVEAERASLAMHAWLDAEFNHLVSKLEELGELENTLILFVADNGWSTWRTSKGSPREAGIRSPLIVSPPGATRVGGRSSELVDLVDVHATILDYAGAELPAGSRGRSLKPLLEGRPFEGRKVLCGAAFPRKVRTAPETELVALYARDQRWKYVRYARDVHSQELSPGARLAPLMRRKGGVEELFDLEADPHETHDLAGLAENAARLAEFRAATTTWWRESGGGDVPALR